MGIVTFSTPHLPSDSMMMTKEQDCLSARCAVVLQVVNTSNDFPSQFKSRVRKSSNTKEDFGFFDSMVKILPGQSEQLTIPIPYLTLPPLSLPELRDLYIRFPRLLPAGADPPGPEDVSLPAKSQLPPPSQLDACRYKSLLLSLVSLGYSADPGIEGSIPMTDVLVPASTLPHFRAPPLLVSFLLSELDSSTPSSSISGKQSSSSSNNIFEVTIGVRYRVEVVIEFCPSVASRLKLSLPVRLEVAACSPSSNSQPADPASSSAQSAPPPPPSSVPPPQSDSPSGGGGGGSDGGIAFVGFLSPSETLALSSDIPIRHPVEVVPLIEGLFPFSVNATFQGEDEGLFGVSWKTSFSLAAKPSKSSA